MSETRESGGRSDARYARRGTRASTHMSPEIESRESRVDRERRRCLSRRGIEGSRKRKALPASCPTLRGHMEVPSIFEFEPRDSSATPLRGHCRRRGSRRFGGDPTGLEIEKSLQSAYRKDQQACKWTPSFRPRELTRRDAPRPPTRSYAALGPSARTGSSAAEAGRASPSAAERGGRREDSRAASGVYEARAPVRRRRSLFEKSNFSRARGRGIARRVCKCRVQPCVSPTDDRPSSDRAVGRHETRNRREKPGTCRLRFLEPYEPAKT